MSNTRRPWKINTDVLRAYIKHNFGTHEAFARAADLSLGTVRSVLYGARNPGRGFVRGLLRTGFPKDKLGEVLIVEDDDIIII